MTGRAAGMNSHTRPMTTPATPRSPGRAGGYNWTTSRGEGAQQRSSPDPVLGDLWL